MHDVCAVGLFSSRVIAIPVLIVTMLDGPSKSKAKTTIIITLSSSLLLFFFGGGGVLFFVFSIGTTCIMYSNLFPCMYCGIAMVLVDSAVNYYSLMVCQHSAKESHQSNSE